MTICSSFSLIPKTIGNSFPRQTVTTSIRFLNGLKSKDTLCICWRFKFVICHFRFRGKLFTNKLKLIFVTLLYAKRCCRCCLHSCHLRKFLRHNAENVSQNTALSLLTLFCHILFITVKLYL